MEKYREIEKEEIRLNSLKHPYKLERDRLKERFFCYTNYPKINYYSLSLNAAKRFLILDMITRYERLMGKNVLFSCGYNNLSTSIISAASNLNKPVFDFVNQGFLSYQKELRALDIGFDQEKEINLNSLEYLNFTQSFFLELYKKGVIKRKVGTIYYDDCKTYQSFLVKKEADGFYYQAKKLKTLTKNFTYLDLSQISGELVLKLKNLDLDGCYLDEIFKELGYFEGLEIVFNTKSEKTLTLKFKEPELIYGLSFIILNPNLIDVNDYVFSDEVKDIVDYSLLNYSGNDLINHLNGEVIPIFLSTKFDEPIHLGIPASNNLDELLASSYGLPFKPIFDYVDKKKVLVNSGFLNGYEELDARRIIKEEYLKSGLAKSFNGFETTELNISNPYKFGIPVPLHNDGSIAKLPVLYDLKHEVKTENYELNDKGLVKDFLSDDFSESLIINAIRLKNESGIFDFKSELAKEEVKLFKNVDCAIFSEDDYARKILYSLISSLLFAHFINIDFSYDFKKIILKPVILDEDFRRISRANNNLISLEELTKEFSASAIRLTVALDKENIFKMANLSLNQKRINEIYNAFKYPILDKCWELDYAFDELKLHAKAAIGDDDLSLFSEEILKFIKKVHETKKMSFMQAKTLLIYLSIILPSMAEHLRKNVLKLKDPIYYYSFLE